MPKEPILYQSHSFNTLNVIYNTIQYICISGVTKLIKRRTYIIVIENPTLYAVV